MSAVAHTNKHHANTASVQLNSEPAVTSISVSARIEYIQRFSKQAVLVIDDDASIYSQAASHFLANLSSNSSQNKIQEETNVAFISASTKLNDIQMRCRIIEQLFTNTLFDPEKSLAVSILQLVKQHKENITIVVEHAQALSLQIKFELCQIVEIANKTQKKVNVVLFGQEQAAQEVSNNKSIFNNKLAIIDAQSGQLFALDNAKFKSENAFFTNKFWRKFLITAIPLVSLLCISWILVVEHDNFSLVNLPFSKPAVIEATTTDKSIMIVEDAPKLISEVTTPANVHDINNALLGKITLKTNVKEQPANSLDILQALALNEAKEVELVSAEQINSEPEPTLDKAVIKVTPKETRKIQMLVEAKSNQSIDSTNNYYLEHTSGYVIQLAGFKTLDVLPSFVKEFPEFEYHSYQRTLNEQPFTVLTSKVFADKEQAKQAMQTLPETVLKSGPWLKPISEIKREINTFKL